MTSSPTPPTLPQVLTQHFEEFASLWEQLLAAVFSPEYLIEDIEELRRRIAAHLDGLLLGGNETTAMAVESLGGDDPASVFAAAYLLLRINQPEAANGLVEVLDSAEPEQLDAVRRALCHGPIDPVRGPLQEVLASGPAPVAAVAAEVLAVHGQLDRQTERLAEFVRDEDPNVRCAAWRVFGILDSGEVPWTIRHPATVF